MTSLKAYAADDVERFSSYVRETIPAGLLQCLAPEVILPFQHWKAANKASYDALQADEIPNALNSAAAAVALYPKASDDFRRDVYLSLLDNLVDMYLQQNDRRRAAAMTVFGISELWQHDPFPSKAVVNFALSYGFMTDANANHPAAIVDPKRSKFFWGKIRDDAEGLYGSESEQVLLAKYYMVSNERRWKARHFIRRPLSKLIDEGVAAQQVEPVMMALSLWSAIKMYSNDHEDALERIREVFQTFPTETIPDFYSYKMFQTIAAYHFPKYGRRKTEEIMAGINGLKSPPRKSGDNDSTGIVPLVRVEPMFRNIRKKETVVYEYAVNPDGKPEDIKVLFSTLTEKNEKAGRVAVESWLYIPPFVDGKFVRSDGVRVKFTIIPPS